jgi:hypothetical protein
MKRKNDGQLYVVYFKALNWYLFGTAEMSLGQDSRFPDRDSKWVLRNETDASKPARCWARDSRQTDRQGSTDLTACSQQNTKVQEYLLLK